ncbi:MAG: penicillin acylase family protein [Pseudomonadota bacterium]
MNLKKILITLAAIITVTASVGGFIIYNRTGYLDVSGERTIKTSLVSTTVDVYRDAYGVPHIFGDRLEDILFASGYAMAEDRLFQIEMTVRAATGRLAELFGPDLIEPDKLARQNGYTRSDLDGMIANMPAPERRAFKSMVAGINLYVDEALSDPKAKLPFEFKTSKIELDRYEESEILAGITLILRYFGVSGGREITNQAFFDELIEKYDPQTAQLIFDDILPLTDPDAYATTLDAPQGDAQLSKQFLRHEGASLSPSGRKAAAEHAQRVFATKKAHARIGLSEGASRTILIGPERSATGNPLMMQATADGGDLHLVGPNFNFSGLNIRPLGIPVMGRGENIGLLITTGERDTRDTFFVETQANDKYAYRYDGAWRDMEVRTETILVKGQEPVTFKLARTVHGPVILWDEERNIAYTQRWAMWGKEADVWAGTLRFIQSDSAGAIKDTLPRVASTSSNISYADVNGDFGFRHMGDLPQRAPDADPRLPANGDGSQDWDGFVPADAAPVLYNPEKGYVMVWNNSPAPGTQYGDRSRWGKHFRTHLPVSLIENSGKISIDDLKRYNEILGRSFYSVDLNLTSPRFFDLYFEEVIAQSDDDKVKEAARLMMAWDGLFVDGDEDGFYDAPGLPIFLEWRKAALAAIFNDDIGEWWRTLDEKTYIPYQTSLLIRALEGDAAGAPMEYDYFNGRARADIVEDSIKQTLDTLAADYAGKELSAWKAPVFWRYLDDTTEPKDKPMLLPGRATTYAGAATQLGHLPKAIVDNGMPDWTAIMEINPDTPYYYSATPSGGQSWFINTAWKASPHIRDQYALHNKFEYKTVSIEPSKIKENYVSHTRITMAAP